MDKYYYELVVSILDKDGNRRESISITGSNNKETIIKEREKLRLEIAEGKYDKYADKFDEIIITDIEVRDDETNNLLWIEQAIKEYDENKVKKLLNFCEEYVVLDLLPEENIGFLGDLPFIIDYDVCFCFDFKERGRQK